MESYIDVHVTLIDCKVWMQQQPDWTVTKAHVTERIEFHW